MTTSPALSRRGLLAASAAASLFLTARPSLASIGGVAFVGDAAALADNPLLFPDDETTKRLSVFGELEQDVEIEVQKRFNDITG